MGVNMSALSSGIGIFEGPEGGSLGNVSYNTPFWKGRWRLTVATSFRFIERRNKFGNEIWHIGLEFLYRQPGVVALVG